MLRLAGVLHLLVLVCLAAYVVLLPLLISRRSTGTQRGDRPVRGPRARPRPPGDGDGDGPTRRAEP